MVQIKTNLANRNNYGSIRSVSDIKFIVIHYTANDGDTDENNGNYFANNLVKSSAHYFVDSDSITQSVPDNYVAWHCGAITYKHDTCRNANSIGIELCDDLKNGVIKPSAKTIANALELVSTLMTKYSIPKANVIRHYDVTGKLCPEYWCGTATKNVLWKTEFWDKISGLEVPAIKLQQYGCSFSNIDRIAYVPMEGTKGETVSSAAKRIKWNGRAPDAICNAELFDMKTYKPSSGYVYQAKESNLTETLGIGFANNKTPILSYKNNINAPDWIGAYPPLVRDSKIAFTSAPSGLGGKSARTALAMNGSSIAMMYVTASDACTLEDFANAIIARGFTTAINLDGGGSTACITPGVAYDQGRKVRGKIALWLKGGTGNKLAKTTTQTTVSSNSYQVKITATSLNVRSGAGTSYKINTTVSKGQVYTIVDEYNGWGKLKSGAGWINLNYTTKV